jgi:hypothetical protein
MRFPSEETLYRIMLTLLFLMVLMGILFDTRY